MSYTDAAWGTGNHSPRIVVDNLAERQEEIALELKQAEIGKAVEVMVEGVSKAAADQWSGRSGTNQIVNFSCETRLTPGDLLMVRIEGACQNSLRGKML